MLIGATFRVWGSWGPIVAPITLSVPKWSRITVGIRSARRCLFATFDGYPNEGSWKTCFTCWDNPLDVEIPTTKRLRRLWTYFKDGVCRYVFIPASLIRWHKSRTNIPKKVTETHEVELNGIFPLAVLLKPPSGYLLAGSLSMIGVIIVESNRLIIVTEGTMLKHAYETEALRAAMDILSGNGHVSKAVTVANDSLMNPHLETIQTAFQKLGAGRKDQK